MSTPLPQCDAYDFIYDQSGDPAANVLVTLQQVIDANRKSILLSPLTTLTDSIGAFHFTLPEDAKVTIAARATGLWDCPDGRVFTVPPGPSGQLIPDFTLPPSTIVEPPLIYLDGVLSIPKATATQDGYLSAADYVAFLAGATSDMGVVSFNTRTGEVMLLSNDVIFALGYVPINKDGDAMNGPLILPGNPTSASQAVNKAYVDANRIQNIPGVAGTYPNPSSITVNAQGQIIAITRGAPDTTPPVITVVTAISITATGVTVTWTTNEPADSQVEYGPTTAYGSSSTLDSSPVTTHSVTITGLTANTLYHFRVKSRDTASNLATSGDSSFTTTTAPDTTAPVITGVHIATVAPTSANVAWTTDEASDSQVEYGPTTSYGSLTTIDPSLVTTHSVPLTGLTESTLYHFRVKTRDAASNLATSSDFTFTTPAIPDTTPPGISAVMATGATSSSVAITWTTDEASDSQVEYGPTTSYGSLTTIDPSLVTSHSVPLTGLVASTLYHYRVKSKDASSNLGTSPDATFTTLASSVDLLNQLVSYWKMDALAGGVTPDELGNNDFTAGLAGDGAITLVTSEIGLGNELAGSGTPGSNGATLYAFDNLTQHFAGSFSIAGWLSIQVNDGTQLHTVLSKGGNAEPNLAWDLWYNEYVSKWEFVVYTDGTNATRVPAAISMAPVINTPYFIVGIYDEAAGEVRLSINGGTPVVAAFSGTIFNSALSMNSIYPALNIAHCSVDEIGLWKRALTPDEIAALYNGGAGLTHPFT